MKNFLLSLKIIIKLLAEFDSILFLSVLLIIFSVQSIQRIIQYKTINEEVDILKLRLESLDLACKEFMYEGYKSIAVCESIPAAVVSEEVELKVTSPPEAA